MSFFLIQKRPKLVVKITSHQFHCIADLLVEGAFASPHDRDPERFYDCK